MKIGIDTMSFYVPENRISIEEILARRLKESQELYDQLQRARHTTEQEYMRLNHVWQDSVCLAAQSILPLVLDASLTEKIRALRYLISATETPVDSAKPISAFIIGILNKINPNIPHNMVSYQTMHACASGSISILQAASLISTSTNHDASAIVATTDIAHYESPSSAEITQGAGAIALLITKNPRLLSLNIKDIGFSSADVDDFFRPLQSKTAMVKGRYSMQCYIDATYSSLEDFATQHNKSILDVLLEHDYLVLHAPFKSMPTIALNSILRKKLKLETNEVAKILEQKHIPLTADVIKDLGNTYTSSTFFSLGHILNHQYQILKEKIVGKKVLIIAYGAGNTSVVMQAIIESGAPNIIKSWNYSSQLNNYTDISFEDYLVWTGKDLAIKDNSNASIRKDQLVYIKEIRDDLYRIYDIT